MWHILDVLLIALLVLLSSCYAIYSMSSIRVKRACLSLLVRCFGVRVFNVFSPRLTGCSGCSSDKSRLDALRKRSALK